MVVRSRLTTATNSPDSFVRIEIPLSSAGLMPNAASRSNATEAEGLSLLRAIRARNSRLSSAVNALTPSTGAADFRYLLSRGLSLARPIWPLSISNLYLQLLEGVCTSCRNEAFSRADQDALSRCQQSH
jgi:hypothetical protein